jgi:hypothetical protein
MARPGPRVIDTFDDGVKYIEILDRPQVYWVEYQGAPISVRHVYHSAVGTRIRYPKTAFNNRAHAENLAAELNCQFNSNDYTVASLKN